MAKTLLIAPAGLGAGASSVCAAIIKIAQANHLSLDFFLPVKQRSCFMADFLSVQPALSRLALAHYLHVSIDQVVDQLVETFHERYSHSSQALVLGLTVDKETPNAEKINAKLAEALSAKIILVASGTSDDLTMMNSRLDIALEAYQLLNLPVVGFILNKLGAPRDRHGKLCPEKAIKPPSKNVLNNFVRLPIAKEKKIPLLGAIPWSIELISPELSYLEKILSLVWLNEGRKDSRIRSILLGCGNKENFKGVKGLLLVTTADRLDLIESALKDEKNISGILLSGSLSDLIHEEQRRREVLEKAKTLSVPVLQSHEPLLSLVWKLQDIFMPNPQDSALNACVQNFCAKHLDGQLIMKVLSEP